MATARKQLKKKLPEEKADKNVYDFGEEDEKKVLSGSEDDVREGKSSWLNCQCAVSFSQRELINAQQFCNLLLKDVETPVLERSTKKRNSTEMEEEGPPCAVGYLRFITS